jgi:hypothetical protein
MPAVAAAVLATVVPIAAAADVGPSATPQRLSLSFTAATVPDGGVEVEVGSSLAPGFGALPVFTKYGLTRALELEAGVDAVRWVDGPGGGSASIGDLLVGARWRVTGEPARVQVAFGGWVKAPTAGDVRGSGEADATVAAIASIPLAHGLSLDANLWWSALGQEGGGALGQGQAIATLGFPLSERWSSFVEVAVQKTAASGDGGFVDAGFVYAASRKAVFDVSFGSGWSDGYPDWAVNAGWTVLLRDGR